MHDYLGIFLLISALLASPYISKAINFPISVIEIAIGAFLAYTNLYPNSELIENLAIFGFYYLMFLVGMEIDLNKKNIELKSTFLYVLILNTLSFFIVYLLNLNFFYLMIFPLMSVGMVKIISKESNSKWIEFSLMTGILGEIFSIIILTILEAFNEYGNNQKLYEHLVIFCFLIFGLTIFYLIIKNIFKKKPELMKIIMPTNDGNSESFRIGFFLIIFLIGIMDMMGYEVALGAFVAGLFISNFFTHKEGILLHRFQSLGFGLFIPIFFINVGTELDLDNFKNIYFIFDVFKIVFITIFIHMISVLIFIKKLKKIELVLFSLSHSMPLTLLIVFSTIGTKMHILGEYENNVLIASAILEVVISFSIITFFIKKQNKE